MKDRIYLDNNATTRLDQRVLDAMMPFLTDEYANAASNHIFGTEVNQHVKKARVRIANMLGCDNHEVIFTSGATEAINLAIKGAADSQRQKKEANDNEGRNHIVTVSTEHPAVLDTCKFLETRGFEVTYLDVQDDGLINWEHLQKAITPRTLLVSVMHVNNETGVVQPIKEIANLAHSQGALFMTDATQSVGKIPINVNDLDVDLLTFSAHKFYGPKGIGGIYVRSKRPNKPNLVPLLHGGGHERGFRSGTLNVASIVGLGKAAEIAADEFDQNSRTIGKLRLSLESKLLEIPGSFLNGNLSSRIYSTANIGFNGVDSDALMASLPNIMISNGSACTSTKQEPSHVLLAMGRLPEEAYSCIRFSIGKFNTEKDILEVVLRVSNAVEALRSMTHGAVVNV